ncbi:NADP-dependent oxidoreductase [Acidimangrovimonas sediminis]|uniref:NADP-dependent oxidoreductase n=1 Tax=Acidimangrovimonas sediminis TaxID=2056283 RepID=UPI000C809700|nr:NADP-dependent oxidoreductase [Acidimangrovimonas sediminis]
MRAVQYGAYGGPEVLEEVTLPDPVAGPGEVVVALSAASVTPFDCKLRAGALRQFFEVDFPKVPGRDGAGVVQSVGAGVTGLAPGDAVCLMAGQGRPGSYATLRLSRPEELLPIPAGMVPLDAAALVNAGLSAWICVAEVAHVAAGMRVLIHGGSGAVGGLIVQLCRHLGAEVTATCSAAHAAMVEGLGASRVIAYDREDFGTLRDMDVVFDLVGGETHARSYPVLRRGAHLVWLVAEPIEDRGAEHGVRVTRAMISDRREPVAAMLDLAARGVLRPLIAGTLPLSRAAEAQRLVGAGRGLGGRMMLAI